MSSFTIYKPKNKGHQPAPTGKNIKNNMLIIFFAHNNN